MLTRWLCLILLWLLPLQLSWAAAASYCQHETQTDVSHFGHHRHLHDSHHPTNNNPLKIGGLDMDCASCHISCSSLLQTQTPSLTAPAYSRDRPELAHGALPTPPTHRPDRPQWLSAYA